MGTMRLMMYCDDAEPTTNTELCKAFNEKEQTIVNYVLHSETVTMLQSCK